MLKRHGFFVGEAPDEGILSHALYLIAEEPLMMCAPREVSRAPCAASQYCNSFRSPLRKSQWFMCVESPDCPVVRGCTFKCAFSTDQDVPGDGTGLLWTWLQTRDWWLGNYPNTSTNVWFSGATSPWGILITFPLSPPSGYTAFPKLHWRLSNFSQFKVPCLAQKRIAINS